MRFAALNRGVFESLFLWRCNKRRVSGIFSLDRWTTEFRARTTAGILFKMSYPYNFRVGAGVTFQVAIIYEEVVHVGL